MSYVYSSPTSLWTLLEQYRWYCYKYIISMLHIEATHRTEIGNILVHWFDMKSVLPDWVWDYAHYHTLSTQALKFIKGRHLKRWRISYWSSECGSTSSAGWKISTLTMAAPVLKLRRNGIARPLGCTATWYVLAFLHSTTSMISVVNYELSKSQIDQLCDTCQNTSRMD